MSNLVKKIQNTAFQQGLWQKNSRLILGVSGGPDSVCLLDIMAKLAPKYGLELIIAHVNYGLRGRESDGDEKFVRKLAKGYGLKIFTLAPSLKRKGGNVSPSENDMREIRYDFFERVRKENNFNSVAVAHNLDDQVETFFMRVIRGSGLRGLSAMKYKNGKIIRPLLGTTRQEILEYLNKAKISYRTDRTNKENLFFRNKVRNKLIPFLEKNFNPKIKNTIFDATVSIAEDLSLIEDLAKREVMGKNFLSVKKIINLHPALQRRVLLEFINMKKEEAKDVEAAHVEEMIRAIRSTKRKNQVVVFKGLKMVRKGDKVIIDKLTS